MNIWENKSFNELNFFQDIFIRNLSVSKNHKYKSIIYYIECLITFTVIFGAVFNFLMKVWFEMNITFLITIRAILI